MDLPLDEAHRAVAAQNLRASVIVPVFNNGELLRTRSFPSLAALPQFEQLHVLLIDDGSTYAPTREAVAELSAGHPNVTAYFHEEGGSGSASRARNTGLDLSFTPYTAFLDPDDEFLHRGPWPLIEGLEKHDAAQLALGNQLRIFDDRTERVNNTAHYLHHRELHHRTAANESPGPATYRAGAEVLAQARFRPTNLSSMVIRTDWLRSTGIRQVMGAAGQDSLFFLQTFAAADTFAARREQIYAYHAETPGSMVNTVTAEYFRKCLIRERAQAEWLRHDGLLETYVESGLERAFAWYLKRLRHAPRDQREEASQLLREIARLYVPDPGRHSWRYPETMAFFRRPGLPSWEGVKPWAGAAKRVLSERIPRVRRR